MVSFLKKHILIQRKQIVTSDDQLQFLQRLLRLLKSGYSLIDALKVIKWDKHMSPIAEKVLVLLKSGLLIDQALDQVNFHHTITSYLYFNRTIGDLQVTIKRCIQMYDSRVSYIKKFQQIIRYPVILIIFFSILLYFIKNSILPSFIDLFPPSSTAAATVHISVMIIDIFIFFIVFIIIASLIALIIWRIYKKKIAIEQQIKFYKHIPLYNTFLKLQTSFLFATHLSNLMKTGMPLKSVLLNISQQDNLPIISYYSDLMIKELSRGLNISFLMENLSLLEKQLTIIFQKNPHMDDLEKDLTAYADLLIEEIHRKIIKTLTLVQPVLFIFLASFIVFIYITLMWPMFQLINSM